MAVGKWQMCTRPFAFDERFVQEISSYLSDLYLLQKRRDDNSNYNQNRIKKQVKLCKDENKRKYNKCFVNMLEHDSWCFFYYCCKSREIFQMMDAVNLRRSTF